MPKPKSDAEGPQRSCLGCGAVRDKSELLRFVITPDRSLVADLKGKLPGRGAYTCISSACLVDALKKRRFARAFKGEVAADEPETAVARIATQMSERIGSYLALANKAGKVVSGSDRVAEALRKGKQGVLFIASDISPDSGEKFESLASRAGTATIPLFTREQLAGWLGKELRTVAAVEEGGFTVSIAAEFDKYRNFFNGGVHHNE
jgi:uncharacterized protein